MHRFYCPHNDLEQPHILMDDPQEVHHLRNVLRLKNNGRVEIFDGKGRMCEGVIVDQKKSGVQIQTSNPRNTPPLPEPRIWLACAIPKKGKFEWIVEKSTELGVQNIIPMITQRSDVRPKTAQQAHMHDRYHAAAVSAAKQCSINWLPTIHPVTSLPDVFRYADNTARVLIAHLKESSRSLAEITAEEKLPADVLCLIGPEGDFTDEEIAAAIRTGAQPLTLGPLTLRVETAALTIAGWFSQMRYKSYNA